MGCKTVPITRTVNPVELLDDESAFYIAIPSSADSDLIQKIIKNYVPNLSDSNIKIICDKIDTVYCGISNKKNQNPSHTTIFLLKDTTYMLERTISKMMN